MKQIPPCFFQLVALLLALQAGCVNLGEGTREPTRFYSLEKVSAPPLPSARPFPKDLAIQIGPVQIPGYLKRSQIVTRSGPNEYRLAEFHRWAEPLEDNIARILTRLLEDALDTDRIGFFPWKRPGQPDYQVIMDVLRFEGILGEEVLLNVKWSVLSPDQKKELIVEETRIREQPEGPGYPELVAAMSRSLADLSGDIAHALTTLSRRRPVKIDDR